MSHKHTGPIDANANVVLNIYTIIIIIYNIQILVLFFKLIIMERPNLPCTFSAPT